MASDVLASMEAAVMGSAATGERLRCFDLKLSYLLQDDPEGPLLATAAILHRGRRTAVVEGRLESQTGMLVATASATFLVGAV